MTECEESVSSESETEEALEDMEPGSQCRRVLMTFNNPQDHDFTHESFQKHLADFKHTRRFVFQLEEGENKTPHFQVYCEFTSKMRFAALKKLLPQAHFQWAKKPWLCLLRYCTKEKGRLDGPWYHNWDDHPTPGKRSDLEAAAEALRKGMLRKDFAETHTSILMKYPRGCEAVREDLSDPTRVPPTVFLLFGAPGCGKSRLARRMAASWYCKDPGHKWFHRYDQEDVLILDDFAGAASKMDLLSLLRLLDRYSFQVQTKGGMKYVTSRTIVITSNYHPLEWYDWSSRVPQWGALTRRIDHVITYTTTDSFEAVSHDLFFPKMKKVPATYHDPSGVCLVKAWEMSPLSPYPYDSVRDYVYSLVMAPAKVDTPDPLITHPIKSDDKVPRASTIVDHMRLGAKRTEISLDKDDEMILLDDKLSKSDLGISVLCEHGFVPRVGTMQPDAPPPTEAVIKLEQSMLLPGCSNVFRPKKRRKFTLTAYSSARSNDGVMLCPRPSPSSNNIPEPARELDLHGAGYLR